MKIKLDDHYYIIVNSENENFDLVSIFPELHYPGISEDLTLFQHCEDILNKGQVKFSIDTYSIETTTIIMYDMLRHGWKRTRFDKYLKCFLRENFPTQEHIIRSYVTYKTLNSYPTNSLFSLEITVDRDDIERFKEYLWELRKRINIKICWIEGDPYSQTNYNYIII